LPPASLSKKKYLLKINRLSRCPTTLTGYGVLSVASSAGARDTLTITRSQRAQAGLPGLGNPAQAIAPVAPHQQ